VKQTFDGYQTVISAQLCPADEVGLPPEAVVMKPQLLVAVQSHFSNPRIMSGVIW
jgi:hypothetical protein